MQCSQDSSLLFITIIEFKRSLCPTHLTPYQTVNTPAVTAVSTQPTQATYTQTCGNEKRER